MASSEQAYVYILSSSFKRLYIGVTTRLQHRVKEHKLSVNQNLLIFPGIASDHFAGNVVILSAAKNPRILPATPIHLERIHRLIGRHHVAVSPSSRELFYSSSVSEL
jgi:hypothetical protein